MKEFLLYTLFSLTTFGACWLQPHDTSLLQQEKYEINSMAEIIRDRDSKTAILRIHTDDNWKIFAGPTLDLIDMTTPLLKGKGPGSHKLKVPNKRRSYFLLLANGEMTILAEKHLPVKGGYNFRDLGGHETKDGRLVKWGKLFRSDDLYTLTVEDIHYLSSIPFTSIVDFRCEKEVAAAPNKEFTTVVKKYSYPINPEGFWTNISDLSSINPIRIDSLMCHMNVLLVSDKESINRYKDFFTLLHDGDNTPFLFHCSSGKDRTGMAAALLLYGLGVDEEDILEDYLLSNTFVNDKYAAYLDQYPSHTMLFRAKPEFLQAGIRQIKDNYGTVENYLEKVLDVDIHKLRQMYLY